MTEHLHGYMRRSGFIQGIAILLVLAGGFMGWSWLMEVTLERIEIRGFGSFSLHYRAPRLGRNPKTGQSVRLDGKFVPHFKPGKELRDRVNNSLEH